MEHECCGALACKKSPDAATKVAGAAECEKIPVADRFHLIENAHQAVQDALMALLPARIFLRQGDGWIPADPGTGRLADRPLFTVPEDQVEGRSLPAQLTLRQAQRYRHTLKLLEWADQGLRSAEIAQSLGIPLKEVQQLRRAAVKTLDTVEAKIHTRIQAGQRRPGPPGRPSARPASDHPPTAGAAVP